jgi:hypothetical protein
MRQRRQACDAKDGCCGKLSARPPPCDRVLVHAILPGITAIIEFQRENVGTVTLAIGEVPTGEGWRQQYAEAAGACSPQALDVAGRQHTKVLVLQAMASLNRLWLRTSTKRARHESSC